MGRNGNSAAENHRRNYAIAAVCIRHSHSIISCIHSALKFQAKKNFCCSRYRQLIRQKHRLLKMLDFWARFEKQTFRRLSLNTATRHLRTIIRLTSSSGRTFVEPRCLYRHRCPEHPLSSWSHIQLCHLDQQGAARVWSYRLSPHGARARCGQFREHMLRGPGQTA